VIYKVLAYNVRLNRLNRLNSSVRVWVFKVYRLVIKGFRQVWLVPLKVCKVLKQVFRVKKPVYEGWAKRAICMGSVCKVLG
jgi:hypothetical protein